MCADATHRQAPVAALALGAEAEQQLVPLVCAAGQQRERVRDAEAKSVGARLRELVLGQVSNLQLRVEVHAHAEPGVPQHNVMPGEGGSSRCGPALCLASTPDGTHATATMKTTRSALRIWVVQAPFGCIMAPGTCK